MGVYVTTNWGSFSPSREWKLSIAPPPVESCRSNSDHVPFPVTQLVTSSSAHWFWDSEVTERKPSDPGRLFQFTPVSVQVFRAP
jgi:hypothetical protein